MEKSIKNFTDIAFTESVKEIQRANGSRNNYLRMGEMEMNQLTPNEEAFIANQNMFYMSTVGENGWPYVQFRGGPKGFLKVLSSTQIGFADFKGNMQYISTGNLSVNNKVALILMDYTKKQRLKIWAETEIVKVDDERLVDKLVADDYPAKIERFILMNIKAYDWNCPQHITQRFTIEQYSEMLQNGSMKMDPVFLNTLLNAQNKLDE
ncbi:MAG: putative pyridoxine 5'-phosphate oxidase superfamily flavin-nucleotide-binding protein [Maribacter sp.]|jgi:predicted pyridoxine 5'-phosphate oxidase superfamily flavin-nucleotide-binding protein